MVRSSTTALNTPANRVNRDCSSFAVMAIANQEAQKTIQPTAMMSIAFIALASSLLGCVPAALPIRTARPAVATDGRTHRHAARQTTGGLAV
jgi:hypothetical protein